MIRFQNKIALKLDHCITVVAVVAALVVTDPQHNKLSNIYFYNCLLPIYCNFDWQGQTLKNVQKYTRYCNQCLHFALWLIASSSTHSRPAFRFTSRLSRVCTIACAAFSDPISRAIAPQISLSHRATASPMDRVHRTRPDLAAVALELHLQSTLSRRRLSRSPVPQVPEAHRRSDRSRATAIRL